MSPRKTSPTAEHAWGSHLRRLFIALGIGALLLPLAVWLVGWTLLGPYANGSMLALWSDFAVLLAEGSVAAWILLLSPATLYVLTLGLLSLYRRV